MLFRIVLCVDPILKTQPYLISGDKGIPFQTIRAVHMYLSLPKVDLGL